MFLTRGILHDRTKLQELECRNPLKSGQCFLQIEKEVKGKKVLIEMSQSPQIGSMFLTSIPPYAKPHGIILVAIPSNRVNVSYFIKLYYEHVLNRLGRNPLKSGQCFLQKVIYDEVRSGMLVAIPSNRVNVSYSTSLFLRIIGNLTPLLREPHYFYAFLFPI